MENVQVINPATVLALNKLLSLVCKNGRIIVIKMKTQFGKVYCKFHIMCAKVKTQSRVYVAMHVCQF